MLAIDIGNTNITTGVFEGNNLKAVYRVPTDVCLKRSSFLSLIPIVRKVVHDAVVMVSVRKKATDIVMMECEKTSGKTPLLVDVYTPMGIKVHYETMDTLGTDRLVCAAAAYHLLQKKKRPVVVIDMGTATTIDYVTEGGTFTGGMIAPGIRSAYEGLLQAAPQLPRLDELSPGNLIGASTSACVCSGVVMGHAAMIRNVVEMMGHRRKKRPEVMVTGGLTGMVRDVLPAGYNYDENLILKGLSLINFLQGENKC